MTNDPINVWSYLEQYSVDENEIIEIVKEVFRSGKLILGENVSMFEKEFSSFVEAKYGVGVGNGTDAIELALKAAGIKDGDEIITVSNTAVPTVSAIVETGGVPVFCDIDEETYNNLKEQMPESIDWSALSLYEKEDTTSGSQTLACTAGACELVDI